MNRLLLNEISFEMIKSELVLRGFEFDETFGERGRIDCDEGQFVIFKTACEGSNYSELISSGLVNSIIIPFGIKRNQQMYDFFGILAVVPRNSKTITVNFLDKSNGKFPITKTKNFRILDSRDPQLCLFLLDNSVQAQYIRVRYSKGVFGHGVRVMEYTLYSRVREYLKQI